MSEPGYCNHRDEVTVKHLWSVDELIECTDVAYEPEFKDINEVWSSFARCYDTQESQAVTGYTYPAACMWYPHLDGRQISYLNKCVDKQEAEIKAIWAEEDASE